MPPGEKKKYMAPGAMVCINDDNLVSRGSHPTGSLNWIEFHSIEFNSIQFKSTGGATGVANSMPPGEKKKYMAPGAMVCINDDNLVSRGSHPTGSLNWIEFHSIELNSIQFKSTGGATGAANSMPPGENKKYMAPGAMVCNKDDNLVSQRTSSPRLIELD